MLGGWLTGLALALGGTWAGTARAAQILLLADSPEEATEAPPTHLLGDSLQDAAQAPAMHTSDYWIGLECVPVEPALRAQLGLAEHEGVMVASVMPESPAARAGVKPYDVLVKAGDKPIQNIRNLVEAVDQSKEKPLGLELFRGGKSQKIELTPAKRPSESAEVGEEHATRPGGSEWDQMRKWIEKTHPGAAGQPPMRFFFYRPGVILPPGANTQALPENLSITITRSGKQPAKITVTRDKDHWEVTENELDKLPADVRSHVERLLGGGPNATFGLFRGEAGAPGAPLAAVPLPEVRPDVRLEKRLEVLERRLEQMHETLDELRATHPEAKNAPQNK
jgi:hypothetical protein